MPESSPTSWIWRDAGFDDLCHDLKNPLMVIRGRAQLIERAVMRSAELPEAERARILHSLAVIDAAVVSMVEIMDDASPAHLIGSAGGKASRDKPRSS